MEEITEIKKKNHTLDWLFTNVSSIPLVTAHIVRLSIIRPHDHSDTF